MKPPSLWFKISIQKPQVWVFPKLCPDTSKKLYVNEFGFCTCMYSNRKIYYSYTVFQVFRWRMNISQLKLLKSQSFNVQFPSYNVFSIVIIWCCYIMVDFATTASQNRFNTYKFSLHKKTNVIQKITRNRFFITFNVNHVAIVKKSFYDTFVEIFKHQRRLL